MFVLSNLLQALASVIDTLLTLYFWVVIISALLSWVNPDPYNPIVRILHNLTEPVFYRVRKWLPFTYIGGLDLSPIVVLLVIQFLKVFLVKTLFQISVSIAMP
ncbi:YggT family protein [Desulfonauticus submarinus]|uniref:YggT family protein n=1 Tax=Desulfonauticus submarinus TaxID=206665 RepID=A0A1H0AHE7_9BACT|nr:YggT family protein [Desulfonauticus submarinus]SDN33028.1 YggT family protein [Desulfonauticus submarinus]